MNQKQAELIAAHGRQLQEIFPATRKIDPVELCRKLRRLEAQGQSIALRGCNGPQWPANGKGSEQAAIDELMAKLRAYTEYEAAGVPVFFNHDPRGYSLKIDDKWTREHAPQLHKDWGGYGIIAPEIK